MAHTVASASPSPPGSRGGSPAPDHDEKDDKLNLSLVSQDKAFDDSNILEIGVECTVHNVVNIDTSAQKFDCLLKFMLTWPATKEEIEDFAVNGKDNFDWKPTRFMPALNWLNCKSKPTISHRSDRDEPRFFVVRREEGIDYVAYMFECSGTFIQRFDLISFPFDVQDLVVMFKLHNLGGSTKYRLIPGANSSKFVKFTLHRCVTTEFKINSPFVEFGWSNSNNSKNSSVYPLFIIRLKMQRNYRFYIARICLNLLLLSLLALLSTFSLDIDDHNDRLNVILVILLAVIAYEYVIDSSLPKLEFLTFIDKYVIFSIFFIVIVGLETAILGLIIKFDNDYDEDFLNDVDKIGFFLLLAIWILSHLAFIYFGFRLERNQIKKLSMGTNELDQFQNKNGFQVFSEKQNAFYVHRKDFDKKKIMNREWVTIKSHQI